MNNGHTPFIGKGWSFPPSFNSQSQLLQLVTDEKDIEQSLFILLSTSPGERILKPDYGCDLYSVVFDNLNSSTKHLIKDIVTYAVLRHEPRIRLDEIDITLDSEDAGKIYIKLYYTIRQINVRSNIVFPFYLKEGTHVRLS